MAAGKYRVTRNEQWRREGRRSAYALYTGIGIALTLGALVVTYGIGDRTITVKLGVT